MKRQEQLQLIRDSGLVAIMRAGSSERLLATAEALSDGGVRAIEVTMTTPGALELIKDAKKRFQDRILFGAGSVLDAETARVAILAGADLIVSPTVCLDVIQLCNRYSVPVLPGCYTPTEAITAWQAGADMIKLFPANIGGPGLIKAFLAPLPQLEIVPVGGVDLGSAADFIRAGATALGVGSSLVNQRAIDTGDMDALTRRAADFVKTIERAREGHG